MNYLHWNETVITDFSEKNIGEMYEKGYVFTRIGKGVMQQTRSLRIDLAKFEPTSENRRVLKKTLGIALTVHGLPLADYDYSLGKLAKDFYAEKFGPGIMSAQKAKEMLTDRDKGNFNRLLKYTAHPKEIGYAICYEDRTMIHYSYPFYDLKSAPADMGMGMMIRAVGYAKEIGMRYIYLGSLQRPSDIYKLQFKGMEWFNRDRWSPDIETAKSLLAEK
jgi:arginyl-tRNA--protein-N-Asp/Glu arginylyltransferase